MDLESRAELLALRIAQEFIDWVEQLNVKITWNVKSIIEMFKIKGEEIGNFCNVSVSELYRVPHQVAKAVGCGEKSSKVIFRKLLSEDVKASKLDAKLYAFGRSLSPRSKVSNLGNSLVYSMEEAR